MADTQPTLLQAGIRPSIQETTLINQLFTQVPRLRFPRLVTPSLVLSTVEHQVVEVRKLRREESLQQELQMPPRPLCLPPPPHLSPCPTIPRGKPPPTPRGTLPPTPLVLRVRGTPLYIQDLPTPLDPPPLSTPLATLLPQQTTPRLSTRPILLGLVTPPRDPPTPPAHPTPPPAPPTPLAVQDFR